MFRPFWIGAAFILAAAPALKEASPATALWAAPSILLAALLIAWAAESAQFFIAQGFALAILAWMQTMPEFAVEAVLAWKQQVPYLFANLTGALRLLTGLGWPAIYFAAAFVHRRRTKTPLRRIRMEAEHSVGVIGLLPPLIYVGFILWKGSLHLYDAAVLIAIYAAYLALLSRMPPQEEEGIEDLERVPRFIVLSPRPRRVALIALFFLAGGALIFFTAEPFLGSLLAISVLIGVPSFIFIQWVAPFISEFPELASTFYWARTVHRAPMALMNMVSSNINQWTLLVAMLPIVFSWSRRAVSGIPLDHQQTIEILMTIGQQLVGMLFLVNMELAWWEAAALFALWVVQFGSNERMHEGITVLYFVWAAVEIVRILIGRRKPEAFIEFAQMWRVHVRGAASAEPRA